MKPVSVLIVDHTAELGGGEIALIRLVENLDRRLVAPSVLLFSDGPLVLRLRQLEVGVSIIPLPDVLLKTTRTGLAGVLSQPSACWRLLLFIARLVRFIRRGHFDLIHTTSLKADLLGGIAARVAGTPLLWHVHDRIASDYLPPRVVKVFRLLVRWLPYFVVANSKATLATLMPLPGDRTRVIYPGVPRDFGLAQVAPREGTLPRVPRVGIVGRISPTKGQDIFIRAAARVSTFYPDTCFEIVGGPLFGQEAFANELGVLAQDLDLSNLVFSGFCTDVAARISALTILVHASPVPEPFGQVVIEGMAAGKPVIATNAGGIPEILGVDQCGFLVPPGDVSMLAMRICELLADPEGARAMGQRGRRRVQRHFTAAQTARDMEEVYLQMVSRRGSTTPGGISDGNR